MKRSIQTGLLLVGLTIVILLMNLLWTDKNQQNVLINQPTIEIHGDKSEKTTSQTSETISQGCFKKNLVIVSKQRSGTHFLRSLLNSHRSAKITKELFRPVEIMGSAYRSIYVEQNLTLTEQQAIDYLKSRTIGRNGFVLQQTQLLNNPSLLKQLKSENYVAVHLVRRNLLKMTISDAVRQLTTQSICTLDKPCAAAEWSNKITLPTDVLLSNLTYREGTQDFNRRAIEESALPWMEVYYEDLARNNTIACNVLEFMGCDCPSNLKAKIVQLNKKTSVEDMVSNYEEVRDSLKGTKYEVFLKAE
eukprot:TRINITY_DN10115_c0_g1_i1.p1 TRINITY_DN10115_c0_g1~~TRINITY_DN10115_c0_g1_i1.p1  ORF type:complete len:304 (-),score=36.86 TRINITY_DN10115_c0_g1_i1:203-1114(-)